MKNEQGSYVVCKHINKIFYFVGLHNMSVSFFFNFQLKVFLTKGIGNKSATDNIQCLKNITETLNHKIIAFCSVATYRLLEKKLQGRHFSETSVLPVQWIRLLKH